MTRVDTAAILATRSEKGMVLVERSGEVTSVSARAREVFDVSGAGDTVIATLAVAHASGRTLAGAMRIANAAAGVVVSKLGTATANIAEVVHELDAHDHESGAPSSVLQPLERVAGLVAHWKEQGLTVGFTNGCFDILHAGHVSLLASARSRCDRLVVALNTDASVGRLKGPSRPVNALASRAAVIASIRHVDCVAAFDDDTPIALIRTLRPDVLVKGADYTVDQVIGAEFAGRVVLAELIPGVSTTAIITKATQGQGSALDPPGRGAPDPTT
jgi:D-beta-D-heptose 7-phosphate kinase/D-beta-D-heptose 1-phosphate adenosyltransferase